MLVCLPCSAVGSRDALGSSNNSSPTCESSDTTDRMNILDLELEMHDQYPEHYAQRREHDLHRKPLHLSPAQVR